MGRAAKALSRDECEAVLQQLVRPLRFRFRRLLSRLAGTRFAHQTAFNLPLPCGPDLVWYCLPCWLRGWACCLRGWRRTCWTRASNSQ